MICLNTNDRCRICAYLPTPKIRLIQVLSAEGLKRNLQPKLLHCFKITVKKHDTLPTSVCELCITRLDTYYNLVKDFYHGQLYLKELHRSNQQINIMIQQTEIKTELDDEMSKPSSVNTIFFKNESDDIRMTEKVPLPSTSSQQSNSSISSSNSNEEAILPSTSSSIAPGGIPMKILKRTKIIQCDYCEKKFTHRGDFNKHLRKHTGEQPFSCEVCHKKFAHTSNLNRHRLVHTGELPFECEKCHKKFNRKDKLAAHKRCRVQFTPKS